MTDNGSESDVETPVPTDGVGTWTQTVLDRFHQPEYTGENRCLPCTIVNAGIAVVLSIVAAGVSPWLGPVVALCGFGVIYVRGYLVPGTPELTARVLPDAALALFHDERPTGPTDESPDAETAEIGERAEQLLLDAGVVVEQPGRDDLTLSPSFRQAWRERIETVRDDDEKARALVADLFGAESVEFTRPEETEEALFVHLGDDRSTRWVSRAGFLADVAAEAELRSGCDQWTSFDLTERARVLASFRLFLDDCPVCGHELTTDEEKIEACCLGDGTVGINYRLGCPNCETTVLKANRNLLQEGTAA